MIKISLVFSIYSAKSKNQNCYIFTIIIPRYVLALIALSETGQELTVSFLGRRPK
jgi:hypothetical protein